MTGTPSCTSTATGTSPVAGSPYAITLPVGTLLSGNYSFTFVAGDLTITKATLTVTADDQTRSYGDANPTFDATISGFKNGETLATCGVTGTPSCTSAATGTSSVAGSPYAITAPSAAWLSGNYSFTFVAGELDDHQGHPDGQRRRELEDLRRRRPDLRLHPDRLQVR